MLGLVLPEGALGHLEGGHAVIGCQGLVGLQHDPAVLGQMMIDLLHGPGAVFCRGIRIVFRILGQGGRLQDGVGRYHVLPVAVFPLQILGHHHQGLDLPVQPDQGKRDLLRFEGGLLALRLGPMDVREPQEVGEGVHPRRPDAVDGLVDPAHAGGGHVGEGARISLLRHIDGIYRTQEDPFVVGMGGDDQQIRPGHGGFGLREAVGQPAGAQDGELADAEGLLPSGDVHAAAPFLQRHGAAKAVGIHIQGEEQGPLPVELLQGHPGRLGLKAEEQDVHGPVPLGPDMQNVLGTIGVVGHQLAVVGVQGVDFRVVFREGIVPGDLFRLGLGLLRLCGHDAEQHQDGQAQNPGKQPSFVHGAHILLL